jgi:hypothetical protein
VLRVVVISVSDGRKGCSRCSVKFSVSSAGREAVGEARPPRSVAGISG